MSVYKQKQHKSDFNCQTNDILRKYVIVMKVIRHFFHIYGKKGVLIANILRSLFRDVFQRTM